MSLLMKFQADRIKTAWNSQCETWFSVVGFGNAIVYNRAQGDVFVGVSFKSGSGLEENRVEQLKEIALELGATNVVISPPDYSCFLWGIEAYFD
jgi:hypothetical protein